MLRQWSEFGVISFIIFLFLISKETIGANKKFELESCANLNEINPIERYCVEDPQCTIGLVLVIIKECFANLRHANFMFNPCSEKLKSPLNVSKLLFPREVRHSMNNLGCMPGPVSLTSR